MALRPDANPIMTPYWRMALWAVIRPPYRVRSSVLLRLSLSSRHPVFGGDVESFGVNGPAVGGEVDVPAVSAFGGCGGRRLWPSGEVACNVEQAATGRIRLPALGCIDPRDRIPGRSPRNSGFRRGGGTSADGGSIRAACRSAADEHATTQSARSTTARLPRRSGAC